MATYTLPYAVNYSKPGDTGWQAMQKVDNNQQDIAGNIDTVAGAGKIPLADGTGKIDTGYLKTSTTPAANMLVLRDTSGNVPDILQAIPGAQFGLTLSNNGTDANNDIDIAVGACLDSTGAYVLRLTSTLTKRLDAAWAVGTGNGGLDTGTKANSTWYFVHLIRRDSDGVVDALFSTSLSSPALPAGWSAYRRLRGAIRTDGSGNILGFYQAGGYVRWKLPVLDVNGAAQALTPTARTISVPPGLKVRANIHITGGATGGGVGLFYDPDQGALEAGGSNRTMYLNIGYNSSEHSIFTNTSAQINTSASAAEATIIIVTNGWEEI